MDWRKKYDKYYGKVRRSRVSIACFGGCSARRIAPRDFERHRAARHGFKPKLACAWCRGGGGGGGDRKSWPAGQKSRNADHLPECFGSFLAATAASGTPGVGDCRSDDDDDDEFDDDAFSDDWEETWDETTSSDDDDDEFVPKPHVRNTKILPFVQRCAKITTYNYTTIESITNSYRTLYHVVVAENALESFFELLLADSRMPSLFRGIENGFYADHLHLLVHLPDPEPYRKLNAIVEPADDDSKVQRVCDMRYLREGCERRHDMFCDADFRLRVSDLQTMCARRIVENLGYLGDVERLPVPARLRTLVFRRGRVTVPTAFRERRPFDDDDDDNYYSLETLVEVPDDTVFDRDFVAWIQNSRDPLLDYRHNWIFVRFYFRSESGRVLDTCRTCTRIELGNSSKFERRYRKGLWYEFNNPLNWCGSCKRAPMFRIVDVYRFREAYEKVCVDWMVERNDRSHHKKIYG